MEVLAVQSVERPQSKVAIVTLYPVSENFMIEKANDNLPAATMSNVIFTHLFAFSLTAIQLVNWFGRFFFTLTVSVPSIILKSIPNTQICKQIAIDSLSLYLKPPFISYKLNIIYIYIILAVR